MLPRTQAIANAPRMFEAGTTIHKRSTLRRVGQWGRSIRGRIGVRVFSVRVAGGPE
jgi:hypothetical protein